MKTSIAFLLAAKTSEMTELQHLAQASLLVKTAASLIHDLQRERGLSNLYSASKGLRFEQELIEQTRYTDTWLETFKQELDGVDGRPYPHGARLFSRIAFALHSLDSLSKLRQTVLETKLSSSDLTSAYSVIVSRLMSVIFEAADMSSDPVLTRWLVALFHLIQGKELAGQERAFGASILASGIVSAEDIQRLNQLNESQKKCFDVFENFASVELLVLWRHCQSDPKHTLRSELRKMLCDMSLVRQPDPTNGQAWFDSCSWYMDQVRLVENQMTKMLMDIAQRRLDVVAREVAQIKQLQNQVHAQHSPLNEAMSEQLFLKGAPNSPTLGPALEKSVIDLVQDQAMRLESISAELAIARASLSERKLIERAKGLLMAQQHLTEDAAHKALRDLAMQHNKRMVEVAELILSSQLV